LADYSAMSVETTGQDNRTMWIKICGLTNEAGVAAALDARAEAIGFVFFPPSPRSIPFERAAALAGSARSPSGGPSVGNAEIVALTVDAEDAFLDELVRDRARMSSSCMAASRPPVWLLSKPATACTVMKALPIAEAADLATAVPAYQGVADRILFDAKPPKDATRPGGNGEAFRLDACWAR
jgi:phosphoribosylanthranilate isomerase